MDTRELLARLIVAEEGDGHNDPPLFDDYDGEKQVRYLHQAEFILNGLARYGYAIVQK